MFVRMTRSSRFVVSGLVKSFLIPFELPIVLVQLIADESRALKLFGVSSVVSCHLRPVIFGRCVGATWLDKRLIDVGDIRCGVLYRQLMERRRKRHTRSHVRALDWRTVSQRWNVRRTVSCIVGRNHATSRTRGLSTKKLSLLRGRPEASRRRLHWTTSIATLASSESRPTVAIQTRTASTCVQSPFVLVVRNLVASKLPFELRIKWVVRVCFWTISLIVDEDGRLASAARFKLSRSNSQLRSFFVQNAHVDVRARYR